MAGGPGTPRFGTYPDVAAKPGDSGRSPLKLQVGDSFDEQHYLYDPAQESRDPATTPDSVNGPVYSPDDRESGYNAYCNHDGFDGGDAHLSSLDERKVLAQTVYRVPVFYDDQHNGHEVG